MFEEHLRGQQLCCLGFVFSMYEERARPYSLGRAHGPPADGVEGSGYREWTGVLERAVILSFNKKEGRPIRWDVARREKRPPVSGRRLPLVHRLVRLSSFMFYRPWFDKKI